MSAPTSTPFHIGDRVVLKRLGAVASIAGTQPHPGGAGLCFVVQLADGGSALVPVDGAAAHLRVAADRATAERMLAILEAADAPPGDGATALSGIAQAALIAEASPERAATLLRQHYGVPPTVVTQRVVRTLEKLVFGELSAAIGVSVEALRARLGR